MIPTPLATPEFVYRCRRYLLAQYQKFVMRTDDAYVHMQACTYVTYEVVGQRDKESLTKPPMRKRKREKE